MIYNNPILWKRCQHPSTHIVNAKAATCGANGYTGDTVCDKCGEVVKTGSVINATGAHQYTSSQSGSTITYTCKVCGHTYTEQVPTVTLTVTGNLNNLYGIAVASCDGKSCTPGKTLQVTRGSTLVCNASNKNGQAVIMENASTVASAGAGQVATHYFTVRYNSKLIFSVSMNRTSISFSEDYSS